MSKKPHKIVPDTISAGRVIRVQLKDGVDMLLPDVAGGLVFTGTVNFACNLNVTGGGTLTTSSCFVGRGAVPIGGVIGTLPYLSGAYNCTATIVADSQGFVQCNGQTIVDGTSPMNGVTVPNINNNVFLAGHTTSGSIGGQNSFTITTAMLPPHTHTIDHTHGSFTSPAPATAATVATPANTDTSPASTNSCDPTLTAGSFTSGAVTATHTHPGGTSGSGGNHDHCYSGGDCVGCLILNPVDCSIVVSCNGTFSATTSTCTWPHSHSGLTGPNSVGHTHDMSHTHTYDHTHTMPHTHAISHAHDMSHTHTVTATTIAPSSPGGFANSAVENRPVYLTAKYIVRIR